MIASFALMGDIYRYKPYETEASLWNSYPWQIGEENLVDIDAAIPEFSTMKTMWGLDGGEGIGVADAGIIGFSMFAMLIVLDNLGRFGEDAGKPPDSVPYSLIGVVGASVLIQSVEQVKDIDASSYSESSSDPTPLVGVLDADVKSVTSQLKLLVHNSYSESSIQEVMPVGVVGANVNIESVFKG